MNHRAHSGPALRAAVVVLAALGLAHCAFAATVSPAGGASQGADKPVMGGTLTVANPGDPRSLDPVAAPGPLTERYAELLYEALFASDKDFLPRPMLVDQYKVSADQLVYTFTLRSGVRFHDGSLLTSADVLASLQRYLAVTATGKQLALDIKSLAAPNDATVVLTLARPRYPLLSELAMTGASIFKASVLKDVSVRGFTGEQAIGTGPYKLKTWTPGREIVLERFDGYASRTEENWGGFAGAKHRYLDTLKFPIVSDPNAQVTGLQSGRWDFVQPNLDQYTVLKADRKLVVAALAGANLNNLATNQSKGALFARPEARQALSLLINRAGIKAMMGGNDDITVLTPSYVVRASKRMYSTAGEKEFNAHDTDKAKQLFAATGVGPDDTIRILSSSTFPWLQQMAVVLQAQLKSIGIKSKVDTYDWPTATRLAQSPTGWDIQTIFVNAVSTSPAGLRIISNQFGTGFSSEKLDAMKAAYNAAKTDAEARVALDAMMGYLWSQYANVTVNITHEYAAYTNRLKGYGNFYHVFWNAWLAK